MYDPAKVREFIENIPKKVFIEEQNRLFTKSKSDNEDFINKLLVNKCSICGKGLKYVKHKKPCLHWLLRPKGVDKKQLIEMLNSKMFGFFRVQSYLRWLANSEIKFANVNNLVDEKYQGKLVEETIKYKKYIWSLNYDSNDLSGHSGKFSSFPHYHFSMKIDNRSFIDFGDIHIPFTDEDLFLIAALQSGALKQEEIFGPGMQDLMDKISPEEIVNLSKPTNDETKSFVKMDTIVMAKEGQSISGDEIIRMIEESKKTDISIAKLAQRLNADVKTYISPGDSVPEMEHRSKRKR